MLDSNDFMVCMEATESEALGELLSISSEGDGDGACVSPGLAPCSCWCIFLCYSARSWTPNLVSSFRRPLEVQSGCRYVSRFISYRLGYGDAKE